jgi:hypothetical protein
MSDSEAHILRWELGNQLNKLLQWQADDRYITTWMLSQIDETQRAKVSSTLSARDLWQQLGKQYQTTGASLHLKDFLILNTLNIDQCSSGSDYTRRMVEAAERIHSQGGEISDLSIMHALNRGLTDDWDSTRARWLAMSNPKAKDLLELIDQGKDMELVKDIKLSAGSAAARRINKNTLRSNTTQRSKENNIPTCGHCGKPGHPEKDCWIKDPSLRPKAHKREISGKDVLNPEAKRQRD